MTTPQDDRNAGAASLDLEAIKARAAAATEGPWEWDDPTISQHRSRPEPWTEVVNANVACGGYCYGGSVCPIESDADGEFIAHAREDVPALVAEVERLTPVCSGCRYEPEAECPVHGYSRAELWAEVERLNSENSDLADYACMCVGGEWDVTCPVHTDGEDVVSASERISALAEEVERLRVLTTITDKMVKRGAIAMHQITCDTNWLECHDGTAGCMAIARQVLSAALGGEQR